MTTASTGREHIRRDRHASAPIAIAPRREQRDTRFGLKERLRHSLAESRPIASRSQRICSVGVRLDSPAGCTISVVRPMPSTALTRCAISRATPSIAATRRRGRARTHCSTAASMPIGFLLAHLHRARKPVVRRAVDPGRLHQILAAQQQPCRLRSAQALAAAVADQRRAVLQVHVRDREDLGSGIHEDRHAARRARAGAIAATVSGSLLGRGTGQHVHHARCAAPAPPRTLPASRPRPRARRPRESPRRRRCASASG